MRLCRERLIVSDNVAHPAKAETYRVLAALVGIEAHQLHAATVHRFARLFTVPPYVPPSIFLEAGQEAPILRNPVWRDHAWPDTCTQFCPACLKEAVYHRLSWIPFAVTTCLDHQCLLVRKCPGCQGNLAIRDILKTSCSRCGFALSEASIKSVAADELGLFGQKMICSWLGLCPPARSVELGLPDQPPAVLYHLLEGLRWVVVQVAHHWRHVARDTISSGRAYHHYVTAFRGMVNWPQGFYDFLETHRQGLRQRSTGPAYPDWIELLWRSPSFQFIQEAFDQYLLENYPSPFLLRLHRVRTNPTFRLGLPYLTEADAAQILKVNLTVVKRLIWAGFLARHTLGEDEPGAWQLNLVQRAEVMTLQRRWQVAVPVAATAKLLGTTEKVVLELARVGLLEIASGPGHDAHSRRQVSWASLTAFVTTLHNRVRQRPTKNALPLVGLADVTSMVAPFGCSATTVIQRILSKELRCYWSLQEYSLDSLDISRPDAEMLLDSLRTNSPRLTHHQVAHVVGVRGPTIRAWVKRGLLPAVEEQNQVIYLDREQVLSFINAHIFFEDVTAILGFSKYVVRGWLQNGKVSPVAGPDVGDRTRYLFRRADLEQLRDEIN
jgi:hypothetical protein